MRSRALVPVLVTAVAAALACATAPAPSSSVLDALCADYWDQAMRTSPTWATDLGDRRFDSELGRNDAEALAAQAEALERFAARLAAIDRASLGEGELVTADTLDFVLARQLAERTHHLDERVLDHFYGPQVWLPGLARRHPMDEAGRESFLARLAAFPRWLDGYLAQAERGLARGNVQPAVVVLRVVSELRGLLAKPATESPLLAAAERVPEGERAAYRARILAAVEGQVRPAFTKMLRYVEERYLPRAAKEPGLGATPGGRSAYAHRIWFHTSLRLSPEEVHTIGLAELASLRARMQAIARARGYDGDLASFNAKLRADPALFYASRADVLADARAKLAKAKRFLPRLFGRLPNADCVVEPIESYREKDVAAAFYDGSRVAAGKPATYYVNTYEPRARSRFNMAALSLHEAVPGHHLQITLARELDGLPAFRKHAGVTAFVEGWALYAELLGDEVGFYESDLERYGMLTYQAWRAARLVVDTGIHAMGWSRERAIAFFEANVAISRSEIENEIDRYIMWPGQALAYMIGRREIQALRRRAEQALGERFDLAAFHDAVLANGAVPLSVLRRVVDRWIARRAAG